MLIDNVILENIIYITNEKIYYLYEKEYIYHITINKLLNQICLTQITSLKGRKEAIKELFGYINNPPLYLTNNIILIKLTDALTNSHIYLNVIYIKQIIQEGINCKITFTDNTFLFLCIDIKYIKKQYEKAIKIIQKNININFV